MEEGIEKERATKNWAFVKNLLTQSDFGFEKIAQLADVTVALVKEVKVSL